VITPKPLSTALFVGAGAVENSWAPVLRALNKHARVEISDSNANLYLTRIVYLMRFFKRNPDALGSPSADEYFGEVFGPIKKSIGEELRKAEDSGELRLRDAMPFIYRRFIEPAGEGFRLITTNWDRVVERGLEKLMVDAPPGTLQSFHIHGSVDDHDGLYLPSEEAYEIYRSDKQNAILHGMHVRLLDALESVENLVIYGLSLSPLDPELTQYMASGLMGDVLKRVTIVDRDYSTIASRLRMLLRDPGVQISGVDPTAPPIGT
tara:strand:- start:9348 stop:10139 length:792 start_codon:yes stop_codon:yes gene_type:complete